MSIVPTNVNYNHYLMTQNLLVLNRTYPFLNIQTIGNSVIGKELYIIKLGKGQKKVFYSASIHANEWITSVLLMKFIEDYCIAYTNNSTLYGYSIKNLFNTASIYIMPMINPDGVDLVTGSLNPTSSVYLNAKNISTSFPDISFPNRVEGEYQWCGFKFAISCWLGKCKRNKIFARI